MSKLLIIADWPKGIAVSPVTGFSDMRNVDVFSQPGVLRLNIQTIKRSGTTITGLVKWIVRSPSSGTYYALDDGGKVYSSTTGTTWNQVTGNTTTAASGNGLNIWTAADGKEYLFVARNALLDVYDITGTTWSSGWQSLTSDTNFHPIFISQNNRIYIGNANKVASIQELTTFVPGTGSTYNFNSAALTLPSAYRIRCLEEQNNLLLSGTTHNNGERADIFPWDKTSVSFNTPLRIPDSGVNAMLVSNNTLYLITGRQGNIHVSNGTSVTFIRSLPYHNFGFNSGEGVTVYPGAIVRSENQIYFGVSTVSTNGSSPTGVHGVYGLTLDAKTLTFEYQISTNVVTNASNLFIGALYPSDYILIGWKDSASSAQGIDQVDTSNNFYGSYSGYVDTDFYLLGIPSRKTQQLSQLDVQLLKPLLTSNAVRIKYRTNRTDSFTTLVTFDAATYTAASFHSSVSLPETDQIQFRIELTSPGTGTPELRQLIFQ